MADSHLCSYTPLFDCMFLPPTDTTSSYQNFRYFPQPAHNTMTTISIQKSKSLNSII